MRIVVFGGTGMVGSRIAAEAHGRGHDVVVVTRAGEAPVLAPAVAAVAGDAADSVRVAELVKGADAVAAALVPPRDGTDPRRPFVELYDAFMRGVVAGGSPRTVIVGGAGSLRVAPGVRLLDTEGFPDAFKPEALAHNDVLAMLRGEFADGARWTCISPAPMIGPGERTEVYRTGVGDDLLPEAEDISAEDYAVAFVDQLEGSAHAGQRISVAY